ncbi:molybdopterin-dependent oxidoreductase [Geomesophilobacter sediminis]|uniref:Nitrate reductase n=1 Tax=Geomesophilobacter sediminis TaxID=2798584 RepID=A0A8J7J6W8_9BACT|nr:molybdopterin-dependent oxidoreductase [Geomesophilobacter sediminis]MBJ6724691.1 molybdopterin-dependent oxidoreductase [Geomesophilobacter sediminis]
MTVSRRDFLKASAAAAAFAAAGASALNPLRPKDADAASTSGLTWGKAPCRFCGTGCGVLVGVKDGKIVATKGDPQAPVNKGLNCIKGYFLSKILYGKDRLTKPLIRKGNRMVEASWDEAMNLIAAKFKESIAKHGPNSVAIYGSGQWTIADGYAAAKLFKGGIGTNNVEANARLCMASAVVGFMTTFGSDEPMGCYDDLDLGDTYILWGANMAECHPVLFSRLIDNRLRNPKVKIVDFGTRFTRTSQMANQYVKFAPQSDLALLNAIAHVIVKEKLYDQGFINKHVVFKKGKEKIGYGLEDKFKFADDPKPMTFEEYQAFLKPYTPEYASKVSGVPAKTIVEIARLYADKSRKVCSLWTMGVNEHSRGSWVNNLIYNVHLLTGKICRPGENPMSLTGQPSACGTAREVGTFTHRLPADMVVTNPEHREKAARIWGVDPHKIPDKPSYHTVEMFRALDRGDIRCMWIQCTNPFQSMPNLNRYRKGARKEGRFIVVSDIYPNRTTEQADVILPTASWVEKEGMWGNAERRTHHFHKLVNAPGEGRSDLAQLIDFAHRMGYGHLFPYKHPEKEIWEEYRKFGEGQGKDLAPYESYVKARGLRWPVVNGKETRWRYVEGHDPYVKAGEGIKFYKNKATNYKAVIWARPYEPPAEIPDKQYPFWLCTGRVLEHWHTATMTGRVMELKRANPNAVCEMHPEDAKRLGIKNRDKVRVSSRRGSVVLTVDLNGRGKSERGNLFVPFFDETKLINELCIDAYCPLSGEPDFKKCAVRVEKA